MITRRYIAILVFAAAAALSFAACGGGDADDGSGDSGDPLADFESALARAEALADDPADSEEAIQATLEARLALERAVERLSEEPPDEALADGEVRIRGGVEDLLDRARRTRSRIDESRVYYGNTRRYEKPALVDVDRVYAAIPEYREIVRTGIDKSSPRYLMLLKNASLRFRGALRAAARREGYDLIGGLGAISPRDGVPDATALVLELIAD